METDKEVATSENTPDPEIALENEMFLSSPEEIMVQRSRVYTNRDSVLKNFDPLLNTSVVDKSIQDEEANSANEQVPDVKNTTGNHEDQLLISIIQESGAEENFFDAEMPDFKQTFDFDDVVEETDNTVTLSDSLTAIDVCKTTLDHALDLVCKVLKEKNDIQAIPQDDLIIPDCDMKIFKLRDSFEQEEFKENFDGNETLQLKENVRNVSPRKRDIRIFEVENFNVEIQTDTVPEPKTENDTKLALIEEEHKVLIQQHAFLQQQMSQREAESLHREQALLQEIKLLKETIPEEKDSRNVQVKELEETIVKLKSDEAELRNQLIANEKEFTSIMVQYEEVIANKLVMFKNWTDEHTTTKQHLANLEVAFSDLHTKYERCKQVIDGYRKNEKIFHKEIASLQNSAKDVEDKYESLKCHTHMQLEKANQQNVDLRTQMREQEIQLTVSNKRLEIQITSLQDVITQKTKENADISKLLDELTGKKV